MFIVIRGAPFIFHARFLQAFANPILRNALFTTWFNRFRIGIFHAFVLGIVVRDRCYITLCFCFSVAVVVNVLILAVFPECLYVS